MWRVAHDLDDVAVDIRATANALARELSDPYANPDRDHVKRLAVDVAKLAEIVVVLATKYVVDSRSARPRRKR